MVKITFPDKSVKQFPERVTGIEIAKSISEGLARNVFSISVNGEVWDLSRPIEQDAVIKLHTWDDKEGRAAMWHSSAHLMAAAIEELYPGTKFGIGPDIENGFYYDIDLGNRTLSPDDLPGIEKKMQEITGKKQPFIRKEVPKQEALEYYKKKNDEYKVELINELEDGYITFYELGDFVDLCRGPHLSDVSPIKAVKLLSIAGAYWRGDESRKQMTRVYGIAFPKKKLLDEYLEMLEEARKRDHRKIGREMELFAFSQTVGQGLPLWLPKGAQLREILEKFLKKVQLKAGYLPVITPHIGNKNLYILSGHYDKYGDDSFRPISTPSEGEEFFLKPMNCPHHCEIFKTRQYSYKELPVRLAEFGTVYRYEQSGELHGLTRVRGFTQDDAHIFCRPDQLKEEFIKVIDIVQLVYKALNFKDYNAQISLHDPDNMKDYIGSAENWEKAEKAIIEATEEKGLKTDIVTGEAAFYGPKLDFMVKDVLNRNWQLGTIQVDYNLPERFELEFVGSDNQKHRPVMIHRTPFGSMERFVAVLTEHCAGKFPLWLAPQQVIILPISDKYQKYAEKVLNLLNNYEIRTLIDNRNEKTGKKIRDAETRKIPYMLIVGEKEESNDTVSVRKHQEGDLGSFSVDSFAEKIINEVKSLIDINNL